MLSPQNFEACNWRKVLSGSERPYRVDYNAQFSKHAQAAEENDDSGDYRVFSVLRDLTFLHFHRSSDDGKITLAKVESLAEDRLNVLSEVFSEFEDSELRARIADVLWLRKIGDSPHKYGLVAINSYVEAAHRLEGINNNQPTKKRFDRALTLAHQLNQSSKVAQIKSALEDRVENWIANGDVHQAVRYSKLLYKHKADDPSEQAHLMKKAAQLAMQPGDEDRGNDETGSQNANPWLSKDCWELAAKWYFRDGEDEAAYEALREVAGCFVTLANLVDQAILRASFLESAFATYHTRGIPNADEEKDQLHHAMLEAQSQAVKEFGRVATDIGNREVKKTAQEQVAGLDFTDALTEFAFFPSLTTRAELESATRAGAKTTPLDAMIGKKQVNAFGRVTGKKPPATEDKAAAFEYEVFQSAKFDWAFTVANQIEPARQQIAADHDPTLKAIMAFLGDSPIVPPGREHAFATGLLAGFQGDFLIAAHILSVQFEESVRYLLRREGVITSGFSSDQTQYERNLNNFLDPEHETYRKPILELFGGDLSFQLNALLIDERGANLRNEVAHALLPDEGYFQRPTIYFWWLVWHLIVYGSPHVESWLESHRVKR